MLMQVISGNFQKIGFSAKNKKEIHLVAKSAKKINNKMKKTRNRNKRTPVYTSPFDDIFFWLNLATSDFPSWLFRNDKGGTK
jgi:hypothetical protein